MTRDEFENKEKPCGKGFVGVMTDASQGRKHDQHAAFRKLFAPQPKIIPASEFNHKELRKGARKFYTTA